MSRAAARCVVIHAHPDPDSFSAAVRDRAVAALERSNSEVELIDLYRPRYEPALTEAEHLGYYDIGRDHPDPVTAAHIDAIQQADTLIFIYPTWWSGLPAVMKGWLDRTLLPDVAFTLSGSSDGVDGPDRADGEAGQEPPAGAVTPALTNITRIVGITTYGSGRGEVLLLGDAGRRTITRTVRLVCSRRCRTTWLGLHRLDTATPEQRAQFLERVDAKLGALR